MTKPSLLKAIWAVARERGISNEEVHEAIFAGWQKTSVKDLTDFEANRLLDGMRGNRSRPGLSFGRRQAMQQHGRKDDPRDDAEYLVTASEILLLLRAALQRHWTEDTLQAFCLKKIGVKTPRTMREFNKVFWALKAMQRRDEAARRDRERCTALGDEKGGL